jgi:uncharacterized protein YdbL (DUF1318 family)
MPASELALGIKESTMRGVLSLKVALASMLFAACVTINVYFPAAAADAAAKQYWNDVAGDAAKDSAPVPQSPPQSNYMPPRSQADPNILVAVIGGVLYALVPGAHAQDAEAAINMSTPAVNRIKQSMKARFGELEKFLASGAVGLTKDGMLAVRDLNAVALPDRATVKRLVSEDNSDRAQLYSEIARASNHPEWENQIRGAWSRTFVREVMKTGWYYQDEGGAWKQK